ncbi:hypothetical protein KDJ93_06780 [Clostridium butyricum]|uniref:hypothetical protein n=1 Tax=Clostridium butyricum TaxID=1492 RepID=UPI00051C3E23|nr:hypothetical protein [Clostridium butyricum]QUF84604.1 hypothetical protein KDJ93_06780 [Clostridium butyricum]
MVNIEIKSDRQYGLLNDIVDLDIIWQINNFDYIDDEKDIIEAIENLKSLHGIKTQLLYIGDEILYGALGINHILKFEGREVLLLYDSIEQHLEQVNKIEEGFSVPYDDENIVSTGIFTNGSPVYNVYKTDLVFLSKWREQLKQSASKYKMSDEYKEYDEIGIVEYFGFEEDVD